MPRPARIVDPGAIEDCDGTRAYISSRADWSISVALVEDGIPQLAAVYAPVTDEMFLAARGQGATLNGARILANAGAELSGARLAGPAVILSFVGGAWDTIAGIIVPRQSSALATPLLSVCVKFGRS